MRRTYQVLAWLIAGLVAVQAAVIAYFGSGESRYIDAGGVIDKAMIESLEAGGEAPFPEVIGIPIHGLNGGMIIPVVAIALLAVSFGTRRPGARKWAAIVVGLVIVQVMLGFSQGGLPALGLLHGTNALLLFAAAVYAGARVRGPRSLEHETTPKSAHAV
jgi:heme A synthase